MDKIIKLTLLFIAMAIFPFNAEAGEWDDAPDFDYPQKVSKTAMSDLKKALAADNDPEKIVNALIRYSIAKGHVSQESMDTIVEQIEKAIAKTGRADTRALLYHLEARLFLDYKNSFGTYDRENPEGEVPKDYTEWDNAQFDAKIQSLIKQSLAAPAALKACPITAYSHIITYNELGARYCPTLLEFLSMRGLEVLDETGDHKELAKEIYDLWVNGAEGNTAAYIFASLQRDDSDLDEDDDEDDNDNELSLAEVLYRRFADDEYCGLALARLSARYHYNDYKEYLNRFPNSVFAPHIYNAVIECEKLKVSLSYDNFYHSADSVTVRASYDNISNFIIDVFRAPDNLDPNSGSRAELKVKDLTLVSSTPVSVEKKAVPYNSSTDVKLPPLSYGYYVALPRYKVDGSDYQSTTIEKSDVFRVTDLAALNAAVVGEGSSLFAVDAVTGRPQSDVKFVGKNLSGVSDANGEWHLSKIPSRDSNFSLVRGDDRFGMSVYAHEVSTHNDYESYLVETFTDLNVYRPGETVRFVAVLHLISDAKQTVVPATGMRAVLFDTNNQRVDTVHGKTDAYGRFEGEFVIPTDRLNGNFNIRFYHQLPNTQYQSVGSKWIDVSEYKTPSFLVTLEEPRYSYVKGQPVTITGLVKSYSGMPVAGARVNVSLKRNTWSWSWRYNSGSGTTLNDSLLTTDADGRFTITYEPGLLTGKTTDRYSSYSFHALVTDEAGESHETDHNFVLGHRRGVQLNVSSSNNTFIKDKPFNLPITINSTDESDLVKGVNVFFAVSEFDTKKEVLTGTVNSLKPVVDFSKLPSGKYTINVHILGDEEAEKDHDNIVLYSPTDKVPPVDEVMWIPNPSTLTDSRNTGHVLIGVNKPEAHIYYIATSRTQVLAKGWLHYTRGMHDFSVKLPDVPEENATITFLTYHNKKSESHTVYLTNNVKESMNIKVTTFRDLLVPGDKEHWQFTLVDEKGNPRRGAMVLEMMDKAIDDISSNYWGFPRRTRAYSLSSLSSSPSATSKSNGITWMAPRRDSKDYAQEPELNTYDENFFATYRAYGRPLLGAAAGMRLYATNAVMDDAAPLAMEENATVDEVVVMAKASTVVKEAAVDEDRLDKVELRQSDIKVALWNPMLVSDDKGNVSLEFDAPQYSTTWILQAVAFSGDIYTDVLRRQVVTRKPLMVKAAAPRFLRQGDKVTLMARMQNATDKATSADALIEVFNPRTGDVLSRKTYKVQLDSMGTRVVNVDYQVPDTLAFVGLRVKAAGENFGDGEQVMLPVLEAISPVIETTPFYIEAGQPQFSLTMPQFKDDARVTLEYCDNPVWYCITALPTLYDTNYDVASCLVHNLFAEVLARGLAHSNPTIKEAVDHWVANNAVDSTLVSMLERNGDLKIGTLLASPWVNEADRQTLRMESIAKLMDDKLMDEEHRRIVAGLQRLQMSDGGFPWFRYPGCVSSLYTTETVLEIIGELKHLGYLKDDKEINAIVNRAIAYYDKEYLRVLKEHQKYHKNDYSGFSSYVYVRTLFSDIELPKANASMFKNCLKAMTKDWKGTSLSNKAFYAMTLNRNNYTAVARDIVQSIREYALVKPELGMYWDNAQSGWRYYDKVAVTATVLEAMAEVDPRQEELDQVRKWMLLMKQTNDWGSSSLAADAVYAILSTGSQWLERADAPRVTIDGKPLEFDRMETYLGYARRQIPASSLSTVAIERSAAGPAWGSIYSQYRAPMQDIEAYSIPDISVTKELLVYRTDGSLAPAGTAFKVGDKVQVRTIIKNNKDLDFVTLVDERGACFEPVDQLSGYRHADGSWYYLETKDTASNIFFSSLLKGTHVISYDVYVTSPGTFSVGIATAQCQYAPQVTAHSAGASITVTPQE